MGKVYAIANQKGGVAKTTTTLNLGVAFAEQGLRVLCIDLDPQGNLTMSQGLNPDTIERSMFDVLVHRLPITEVIAEREVDIAVASIDLAGADMALSSQIGRERTLQKAIAPIRDQYDYILIDTPPSLGLLTINAFVAATGVIVPVQTEYFALEGLAGLLETLALVQRELNPRLTVAGMLLTMHDSRTRLGRDVEREVREHFPELVFDTVIPRNVRVGEAPSYGFCRSLITTLTARGLPLILSWQRRSRRVAKPKPGMGRGLDAILSVSSGGGDAPADELRELPVELIVANPKQPRRRFDEEALQALAGSLGERGVLQPVLVRAKPGGTYELVAGERRWRAAQIAGLEKIPALVRPRGDAEALELALIENMAREDLNPVEEARACAALVEELGLTREDVGRRVGRGRVAVSNLMRLLDLPDEVLEQLAGSSERGPRQGAAAGRRPRRAQEPRADGRRGGVVGEGVEARARASNAGRRAGGGAVRKGGAKGGPRASAIAPRPGGGGPGDRRGARRRARRRRAGEADALRRLSRGARVRRARGGARARATAAPSRRRLSRGHAEAAGAVAGIGRRGRLAQMVRALL